MSFLPSKLLRYVKKDVLRLRPHVDFLILPMLRANISSLNAFTFLMSSGYDESFEEVSRREIIFYDRHGNKVGCVKKGVCHVAGYNPSLSHRSKGETVGEALARLNATDISFALSLFYNHAKIKHVTVYQI